MDASEFPIASGVIAWLDRSQWPVLTAAALRLGFTVAEADCKGILDTAALLHRLGTDFRLPEWYGANFDALADCLSDQNWQAGPGHVLLIGGLAAWREHLPSDFTTLLDVLHSVAETRAADGQPCWILLDTPAPELPPFVSQ